MKREKVFEKKRQMSFRLLLVLLCCASSSSLAALEEVVISTGAEWKYLDDGSDQGSAWTATDFDDSGWASGLAELGYGEGDEATVVSFGPNSEDKYITTYFRHSFVVDDPSLFVGLDLRLLRDDGAVVHVNGTEAYSSNMPSEEINYLTPAASSISDSEEERFENAILDPTLFVAGDNLIAVELHQAAPDSSDASFDLELSGRDFALGVVRGPYLQQGTDTSVIVRWRTDTPTDGQVAFGGTPDSLDGIAIGALQETEHEVLLTGLTPQTLYYYAVGTPNEILAAGIEYRFVTSPPVDAHRPHRIWVTGDSGTADAAARLVRDRYKEFTQGSATDLWLMLGDNAYQTGTDAEYQRAVFDVYPEVLRSSVLWTTLGNHDADSADSPTQSGPYYDLFTLPDLGQAGGVPSGTEAYYSFDYGNVHIINLDSEDSNRAIDSPMLRWLEDDLAENDADWTIAFWHHAPYSKGSHDSDVEIELVEMRENAVRVLEDFGVDLVLSGHSHSYERSLLLDSHYGTSDTLVESNKLDGGDGDPQGDGSYEKPSPGPAPHEGAVYLVAGSSGRTAEGPLDHPVMVRSMKVLGSVVLDINDSTLQARFLQRDGTVDDQFTILKGGAMAAPVLEIEPTTAPAGSTVAMTVSGLNEGELVGFAASTMGPGLGSCPPPVGGLCLDVQSPIRGLGPFVADATGTVAATFTVPAGTSSPTAWIQALVQRGEGGEASVKTNLSVLTIVPAKR